MQKQRFTILLFYKYVFIHDVDDLVREHGQFCQKLGVRGRVLISPEGINGTISGSPEQCEEYMSELRLDSRFEDVWFKIDESNEHAFPRMAVRARKELVTFRLEDDFDPNEITGDYLSPREWQAMMQREDVVILDGRSDYEWETGHFEGALRPDVKSFREFPAWIRENMAQYKDKTVLTYCTGGIRCEKLSGFLLREGFHSVAQLHGGIVNYAQDPEVQGKGFQGRCYVFDGRFSVPVDPQDPAAQNNAKAVPHRDGTFGERTLEAPDEGD